jgi:hypothetical protein
MTRIISIVGGLQPSAPTIGTATGGDTTASVAFTASSYIGKGTITYTATSSPGGLTATGASSPLTVTGLTNGTAYTFTVVGNTNYGVASVASAASNSITPATSNSFDSIASASGTGSTGVINFSSIPSTYKHLQIRFSAITAAGNQILVTANGDFGSGSYTKHYMLGRPNASTLAGGESSTAEMLMFGAYGSVATYPNVGFINIYDYSSTNKNKTFASIAGASNNTSSDGEIDIFSGLWKSTAAINQINITTSGGNFATTTKFSLYGIKG